MVCTPDSPATKASSSLEPTTPTPSSPGALSVTTPANDFSRPTNPTPNSSKDKGKGVMAPPATPKHAKSRPFLTPGQSSTLASLPSRSVDIPHVATSPDSMVFAFSPPETGSLASPVESWENAINFPPRGGVASATPSGSSRSVATHRQGSTGVRSWFTVPDSDDYDSEQQSLLRGPMTLTVPEHHDYGTLTHVTHVTHADIHPGFWDCFSQVEMVIICTLFIAIVLCIVWTVISLIASY
ncbi:hypothetical protein F4814DRAFT_459133 [Daldinia grandis]|nr:hypothetical protein F4814DRAFT_459133 [Daldinia grandis]